MKGIPPIALSHLLTSRLPLALVDVRTPVEFRGAYIPAAQNIPLSALSPRELVASGSLSTDQPVYLICRSGTRAKLAAEKFASDGFQNTVLVEGGIEAWRAAGLPLARSKTNAISLERQVRIAAGAIVLTGVLLAHFVNPYFLGLAAFAGAGLVFAGITDFCGMALLLARLPWNSRA